MLVQYVGTLSRHMTKVNMSSHMVFHCKNGVGTGFSHCMKVVKWSVVWRWILDMYMCPRPFMHSVDVSSLQVFVVDKIELRSNMLAKGRVLVITCWISTSLHFRVVSAFYIWTCMSYSQVMWMWYVMQIWAFLAWCFLLEMVRIWSAKLDHISRSGLQMFPGSIWCQHQQHANLHPQSPSQWYFVAGENTAPLPCITKRDLNLEPLLMILF